MEQESEIYLVAGATGRTGIHITRALVEKGKLVRILIRNIDNVIKFFSDIKDKFESIIVCDILSNDYLDNLRYAFASKNGKVVQYVISTLSYRFEKTHTCLEGNLTTNERLINFAKDNHNIKKFVLLSSTHVRRPYSLITLRINIMKNNMQWTKYLAEQCLRESGMKYLIIRPVGLILDFPKEMPSSDYTISQGDTIEGKISRSTVGKLVVDTMLDENIPDDTTFECISYYEQFTKPYNYIKGNIKLKPDTDYEKKLVDHILPKRIVLALIISSIGLLSFATSLLARYCFLNRNKIFNFFSRKFKK